MKTRTNPGLIRSRRALASRGGRLTIVGTGISPGQMTVEAMQCLKHARRLVALVADPVTLHFLSECNSTCESLTRYYSPGKNRQSTYREIVEYVMSLLEGDQDVCFALYGHPGVFAFPSHELIRRARRKDIPAEMLPGVSTEDCLFADLNIDPATTGCQTFEATDFVQSRRRFDPRSVLVLWQFSIVGEHAMPTEINRRGLRRLATLLRKTYPASHRVIVYEAAPYAVACSTCLLVRLDRLPGASFSPMATLVIPSLSNKRTRNARR